MSRPDIETIRSEEKLSTEVEISEIKQEHNDSSSNSSSESSSYSKTTSKNQHVSFPVDAACSKNNSTIGIVNKKSQSHLNGLQSSKTKIVYTRPPDGGWGWIVVFVSFMINLIADGISLSFGILYVELLKTFGESKSKTSWVGSLFLSIPLLTGPIASALTDHFGCRKVAIVGSVFSALGFVMGSVSTQIEHLFVAFSIAGFGLALCTVTSIVAVAYYFERKRSLATGLSVSGSGIGTFLFPPFTIYLLQEFGWRNTLLVQAGIFLTIVFFGMLIRDIDIDDFDTDDDSSSSSSSDDDDSSSNDDSGSDVDSNELDSIPEVDEENEIYDSRRNLSGRLSSDCGKFNRKSLLSRSSRARHISECEMSHEALPRSCTSLINIPTYIKESSSSKNVHEQINDGKQKFLKPEISEAQESVSENVIVSCQNIEDEKKNNAPELTFRRGGYLHNLIRYYPHLLSLYLQPQHVECKDDLTVRTVPPRCESEATEDAKIRTLENVFNQNHLSDTGQEKRFQNGKQSPVISTDAFGPSVLNESVSIVVPSSRPSRTELLNYHKSRHHRVNRLARNRHRHRMHQTHLQHDLVGGGNCLNNLRLQRGSLTYRGAMLVISKYKLKASSCPDIYKTSMATINKDKKASILRIIRKLFCEMFDLSSLKNIPFLIFCCSNFLLFACIDIPYVYLPDQAISSGFFDNESASLLISLIGAFNTPGIILTGYIGDKPYLDATMIYAIFTIFSGMALTAIPLSSDKLFVLTLSAIYGFAISANSSLVPVILVELISLDSFIQAYGLLLLLQGIASLLGPPIVGFMYDVSGTYDIAFYVTGICAIISGIMVIPIGKKQNCFFWTERLSRTGSSSSLVFRPLNFLKQVKSDNFRMSKYSKSTNDKHEDSNVSPLLNGKNHCISNVDK